MAQQILQTVIAISGRVDNSFGAIGDAILNVGNKINMLSQKIIGFGKESVKEFASYDDVMREVQALGEYDDRTMSVLSEYNKAIAQTSKYTMEQAAQAEVMMAQLGLNMDQTKTLMPSVMNLATAANIDLASSLDYLYYTLNALGMPMEDANVLSDQMSKTAAISAADIDTLGQSMQRLGSAAQFFSGGSSEILAILGGISQFGSDMQGSNAGTQLRNFMLTLLAPTKSKGNLMETLGVSDEEWADFEAYMEEAEIDVNTTAEAMNKLGLSVYDSSTGELKPAIQIIGELNAALSTLSEEEKNQILGNLFGKRTTTTALNLINSLSTIIDYQNQIKNNSAGYTQAMGDTMEGGIGGTLRDFQSSLNALNVTIGEIISPEVGEATGWITDIVNSIANLDNVKLSALTGAMEGIALVGPGIMSVAAGFKLIGFAMTPVGKWVIGATALAAAIGAVTKGIDAWKQETLEANFGDMDLDETALLAHVNALGEAFKSNYEEVNKYSAALQTAVDNYTTASTTLSSDLLTSMITGATLTPEQITNLSSLGETMGYELLNGIDASFDKSASYLSMLFGGYEEAASNEEYGSAILLAKTMHDNLVDQARQIGSDFGKTLGSAMDDGIITGDEYSAIMEKMQAYNDAMALAAEADRAADLAQKLHKAQSVSWDSAESFLSQQAEIMNANIDDAKMTYIGEKARWEVYFQEAVEKGMINPLTGKAYGTDYDENGLNDIDRFFIEIENRYKEQIQGYEDGNAQIVNSVIGALAGQSDFGDAYKLMQAVFGNMDTIDLDALSDINWAELDAQGLLPDDISEQIDLMRKRQGDFEKLLEPYSDGADVAKFMQEMDFLINLWNEVDAYKFRKNAFEESGGTEDPLGEFSTPEQLAYNQQKTALESEIATKQEALARLKSEDEKVGGKIDEIQTRLTDTTARPWYYYLTGGENGDMQSLYGVGFSSGLLDEKAKLELEISNSEAEIAALQQELDALTAPEIPVEIAAGDAMADAQSIFDTGLTVDASVIGLQGSASSERDAAQAYFTQNPGTWRVRTTMSISRPSLSGLGDTVDTGGEQTEEFAEGGRATRASIFGEAGPEWAIPEEHSDRVASLFNAAREAAGFTWPELISRNGGLNAGGGTPTQIIYSPTIVAKDSRGVEQKLLEDKERLDRWWKEKQMRDDAEVYA